jgi:hypothetical protein
MMPVPAVLPQQATNAPDLAAWRNQHIGDLFVWGSLTPFEEQDVTAVPHVRVRCCCSYVVAAFISDL